MFQQTTYFFSIEKVNNIFALKFLQNVDFDDDEDDFNMEDDGGGMGIPFEWHFFSH